MHNGVIKPKSDARRPILHVDDAAWAISLAALSPNASGIYNVCSENVTVYELAKRIGNSLNVPVDYGTGDSDKRDYHMDNSRVMYNLEIREEEWRTTHTQENIWQVEKCLKAYNGTLLTRTDMYAEMMHP
jgi:nucleoside-diphosphate-sugar epimerase